MADAIVHGSRPLVYGSVHGVRFHAVSAVTGCIGTGMVNVSGARGLGERNLPTGTSSSRS